MFTPILAALLLSQVTPTAQIYTQSVTTPSGVVEMRTAAQRLTAEGKPDVWLVGAIHVGTKKYYEELQTLLDAQGTVLYEGVKPSKNAPKEQPAAPKPGEQAPKPIYKVLSDALGLEFQLNQINYKHDNWINSDLSMDDLDKLNKEKGGGKPTSFDTIKQVLDPNSPMAKQLTTVLGMATDGMKEAIKLIIVKKVAVGETPGLDATMQEIVLEARNKSALDYFAKTIAAPNPPKSVAIFYGAMHMPDIQKALATTYGYKSADQKWFLAASADPKKMDETGKSLYDMFEKMSAPAKKGGGLLAALLGF